MTLSQDFAICPWCGEEDSLWPEYHNEPTIKAVKRVCDNCKKPYQSILTVKFIEVPVCEHDKAQFGNTIKQPICCFETRKII